MAIHSAADHGFRSEPAPLQVRVGDVFRTQCAIGISEHRVLRPHRDAGYFETAFVRWVTEPDHPCRNSAKGGIEIMSRRAILAALSAA